MKEADTFEVDSLRILHWSFRNIFIAFKVRHFLQQNSKQVSNRQVFFPPNVFDALMTPVSGSNFQVAADHCLDIAANPGSDSPQVTFDQWIIRGWANFVEMILIQRGDTISDLSRRCHPVSVS